MNTLRKACDERYNNMKQHGIPCDPQSGWPDVVPSIKVYQITGYRGGFPEEFNWAMIDQRSLSELAEQLSRQVKNELAQPVGNRVNVPGLRFALGRIAGMATVST